MPKRGEIDAMPAPIAALRDCAAPAWVFAYGSLMWNPEIPVAEAQPALVYGYHRAFCLYSYDYRGSRERPGLVLGLDRGGACRGLALRLSPQTQAEAIDRLWAREMTDLAYEMRLVPARLADRVVSAITFAIRRDHSDYVGRLALDEAARLIVDAAGSRGTCRDYLAGTLRHLDALGLAEAPLRRLDRRVRELLAAGSCEP